MEKRYKIVNESTTGWVLIDNEAQNLTKEQCDKWIDDLLVRGANPNYFKVALQNDPNYPTE
tara:strand:- start:304 stop:486 length:183 start_codon:yes stop_codon:yes gene_type:complete